MNRSDGDTLRCHRGRVSLPPEMREIGERLGVRDLAVVSTGDQELPSMGPTGRRYGERDVAAVLSATGEAADGLVLLQCGDALVAAARVSPTAVLISGPMPAGTLVPTETWSAVHVDRQDGVPDEARVAVEALRLMAPAVARLIARENEGSRLLDRICALSTVGELVSREPDVDTSVQVILNTATEVLEADRGSVMLLAADQPDTLYIAYARGLPREVVESVRVRLGEGVSGTVAATGEPIVMRGGEHHHLSRGPQQSRSPALCVPLRVRDRMIGVLNVRRDDAGPEFDDNALRLAVTFASQAALALDNKRLIDTLGRGVEEGKSELMRLNRDLAQTRRRLDNILQSIPDPVLVTDEHQRLMLANRAAEELLGLRPGLALTRPLEEALAQTPAGQALIQAAGRALAGGFDQVPEVRVERPKRRDYQVRVGPVRGAGSAAGHVIVLVDVTELKELSDLKSEVVSLTSHELKTPIAAIKGMVATLRTHEHSLAEDVRREFFRAIADQADRLANIVTNLLDLSRLEAGRPIDIVPTPAAVRDILTSAIMAVEQGYAAGEHRFELSVVPPELEAEVDARKIEQVVINLLTNSVKYADPGPIHVSAYVDPPDWLHVSVTDRGKGIRPPDLPMVFERYRRVGDEKWHKPGHGLGLHLCKGFVEAHGGTIGAISVEDSGSTFYFRVPLRQNNRNHVSLGEQGAAP